MKDLLIKWFMRLNSFLIRGTNGKLGSRLGTQSILILHTRGRRTGRTRLTPIAYFDHRGGYLLVASNWGRASNPDWLLNLRALPNAAVDVNGRSLAVRAREANGAEYAELWKFVTKRHAPYSRYQDMTSRRIPVVVLEPASETDPR